MRRPKRPRAAKQIRSTRTSLHAIASVAKGGLVTVGDAARALATTPTSASAVLARLTKRRWLARIQRGLYALRAIEAGDASTAPVEDAWVLGARLFTPSYIGGWTAAEHWELTEQIFRPTFVVTSASVRRSNVEIGGVEFRVARVADARMSQDVTVWRGHERVAVSSRERTIADALRNPDWIGGIRHLARVVSAYRESASWKPSALIEEVAKQRSGAAWKRLGVLAGALFPEEEAMIERALAERSAGVVKLDPSVRSRGRMDKRWGLWVNVALSGRESAA